MHEDEIFEIRDRRNAGWAWFDNEVLESGISGDALFVYMALCRFAKNDTQECYPSINRLMKITHRSKPTVIKAVRDLEAVRLIHKAKVGRKNLYTLLKVTGKDSLPIEKVKERPRIGKPPTLGKVNLRPSNKTNITRLKNKTNTEGLKRLEEMKKIHGLN